MGIFRIRSSCSRSEQSVAQCARGDLESPRARVPFINSPDARFSKQLTTLAAHSMRSHCDTGLATTPSPNLRSAHLESRFPRGDSWRQVATQAAIPRMTSGTRRCFRSELDRDRYLSACGCTPSQNGTIATGHAVVTPIPTITPPSRGLWVPILDEMPWLGAIGAVIRWRNLMPEGNPNEHGRLHHAHLQGREHPPQRSIVADASTRAPSSV